jgi:threonine/homoserine efflux transporter RhtA
LIGRDKFAIHVTLEPYLGRNKGVYRLDEMIRSKQDIEIDNLVIAKVEGSYRKTYLDLSKYAITFCTIL